MTDKNTISLSNIIIDANMILSITDNSNRIEDSKDYLRKFVNDNRLKYVDRLAIKNLLSCKDHQYINKINRTVDEIQKVMEN